MTLEDEVTNLKQLAKELLEKAGKATPGPWWYVGSLSDEEACKPGGTGPKLVANPVDVDEKGETIVEYFESRKADKDADYIAAASPDVITALAQAYLEAVELAEYSIKTAGLKEEGFGELRPLAFAARLGLIDRKSVAFLSRWAAPGEGET